MVGMTVAKDFSFLPPVVSPPPTNSSGVLTNSREVVIRKFYYMVIVTNIHMIKRLEGNMGRYAGESMTAGGVGCEYMGLLSVASV